MLTRQGKRRRGVVERSSAPTGGRVTQLALLTESESDVIRTLNALEVGLMALVAVLIRELIIAADMARKAAGRQMLTCERE